MPPRSPREPSSTSGAGRTSAGGAHPPWTRGDLARHSSHAIPDHDEHEQAAHYGADDEARLLYLRNMGNIADQRRKYWEDALTSIARRTTFIYLAGVVVFCTGIGLMFVGAWLIAQDNTLISAIPSLLGGLSMAALIPVTTIERGLAKDKVAAESALDKQSTIAHVSGIAAMTVAESREHILADLAGRLIGTIDDP